MGAWWLGFLVIGALILLCSLPLFFLPEYVRQKRKEVIPEEEKNYTTRQDVMASLKRLYTNKLLMYDTISRMFAWFGFGGYYITQAKYIENQYTRSAAKASFFSGSTTVVGIAIGNVIGGLIIWFFKPGPRKLVIFVSVLGLFSWVGMLSGLGFGCPRRTFHGLDTLGADADISAAGAVCTKDCGCTMRVFQPVCGADNVTNYFSPCYAGCTDPIYSDAKKVVGFDNCNCEDGGRVTNGYCKNDCGNNLYMYMAFLAVSKMIGAVGFAGNIVIRLRCVADRDRSFALGVTKTFLSLTTSIPYPLFFGWLADKVSDVVFDKG